MSQVWLGLTLVLALVLSACGATQASPTTAPKAATTTPAAAAAKPAAGATTAATPAAAAATKPAAGATTTTAASATKPAAVGSAVEVKGPYQGEAQALNGAGATFPAVLYTKWFNEYQQVTGVKVNYQSIGSGGGIKSIQDQTVDFGATDGPMTNEQLEKAKGGNVLHIPMALGAVVVTYNIPDLEGNPTLKFTPETLSGIYLGEIAKWNDPKLVADNPSLQNVNQDIVVVHRSDGSGTTYIFTDYLSSVSPEWKSSVGTATSVDWPTGLGGKGNEGVAGQVKQTPYSIGYVEYIYAVQNKLGVGEIKNKDGNFVAPGVETVTNAAQGVADTIAPDLRASIVNAPGPDAYPISGFTWILAYEKQTDEAKAIALTRMLWWAVHEAQQFNAGLGYAPLPPGIVTKAEEKILSITVNGKQAFPGT